MKKPIKRKAAKASEKLSEKDFQAIRTKAARDVPWYLGISDVKAVIRAYRAFMRKRR